VLRLGRATVPDKRGELREARAAKLRTSFGYVPNTPVRGRPGGMSPYEAHDLAGSVAEWRATTFGKPYPYTVEDEWTG
jgi:hypothetical protein